jgi:hypothetical protein
MERAAMAENQKTQHDVVDRNLWSFGGISCFIYVDIIHLHIYKAQIASGTYCLEKFGYHFVAIPLI